MDLKLREEVFPHLEGSVPSVEQVEAWFWERLASQTEARILYCSDIEGTAFPGMGEYGEHKWSLQRLADHERSLLRFVHYAIPGVNIPMLYFGMLFAMFCWHVEDNYMYSVSYLHVGAPKTWYGVSPKQAHEFDAVFNGRAFTQAVEIDPQLMLKKASMLPPAMLLQAGVRVCRATQQPGQFIVTLPQAYHAGFSHGFNAAEAVNFMLLDWLPYAYSAAAFYRSIGKQPVLDLEHILVLAAQDNHSPEVFRLLRQVVEAQLAARRRLRRTGLAERMMAEQDRAIALGRGPPCLRCGHICHFAFVQIGFDRCDILKGGNARLRPVTCLEHVDELPAPGPASATRRGGDERVLFTRYSDDDLLALADTECDGPLTATLPPPDTSLPALPPTLERALHEHKRQKVKLRG